MKIFYIVLGCVALGFGAVGVVLPLLPTTPFLLLAAFSFAKSSPRLNAWFKGTQLYRDNLESLNKREGMTRRAKVRVLLTVTLFLSLAAFAMRNMPFGLLIIGIVWVAHVIGFGFVVKTKREGGGANG